MADAPEVLESEHDEPVEIVLPWWQHPVNILTIMIATALVAAMVGWLAADAWSEPKPNEVDIGFLQDMRDHHENAVGMSNLFLDLDGTSPSLRTVARSVVMGQSIDIGRMIQLLRGFGAAEVNEGDTSMTWMGMSAARGSMPGMASTAQLDRLAGLEGVAADELFVTLMTAHHLGALEMAAYAATNANDSEVAAMAFSIAQAQRGEIAELQKLINR
jgi:uncharacterized protein (DUF305 family)